MVDNSHLFNVDFGLWRILARIEGDSMGQNDWPWAFAAEPKIADRPHCPWSSWDG